MRAIGFNYDIITAVGEGSSAGYAMPVDVDRGRLRLDGQALVDIAAVTAFYIDERGLKHIAQHEPAWQPLTCSWNAELINDAGTWRVAVDADRLADAKARAVESLGAAAERARQRRITAGDGKAAIYAIKREEAQAWQAIVDASGTPVLDDFPWIKARATRLSVSGQVVADEWNTKATAWMAIGRQIEDVYETAVEAVNALTDWSSAPADIAGIVDGVIWP